MTPSFERVQNLLKKLPGLGFRSAERLALHLLVEHPESLPPLLAALEQAAGRLRRCENCGNVCEAEICDLCADPRRQRRQVCVVEQVPDLLAVERSGAYQGLYHVLHGKLSPLHGVGPEKLNLQRLAKRLEAEPVEELILALSNDIEGEATCHYIVEELIKDRPITVSRIGFGLPSGGNLTYADAHTLQSALTSRRGYR